MNALIEYIKIHRISLLQDLDDIDYVNAHHFYKIKEAEINLCMHFLSVAEGMID
jgi:hypothetical protein